MGFIGYVQQTPHHQQPGPALQEMLASIEQGKARRLERSLLEAAMGAGTPEELRAGIQGAYGAERPADGLLGSLLAPINPRAAYTGGATPAEAALLPAMLSDMMQYGGIDPDERLRARRIASGLEPPAAHEVHAAPQPARKQVIDGVLYVENAEGQWQPVTPERPAQARTQVVDGVLYVENAEGQWEAVTEPKGRPDVTLSPDQVRVDATGEIVARGEKPPPTINEINRWIAGAEEGKANITVREYVEVFGSMPKISAGWGRGTRTATEADMDTTLPFASLTETQKQRVAAHVLQQGAASAAHQPGETGEIDRARRDDADFARDMAAHHRQAQARAEGQDAPQRAYTALQRAIDAGEVSVTPEELETINAILREDTSGRRIQEIAEMLGVRY